MPEVPNSDSDYAQWSTGGSGSIRGEMSRAVSAPTFFRPRLWTPVLLIAQGLRDWIYPRCCWSCSGMLPDSSPFLCGYCLECAFQPAQPLSQWLPDGVNLVASVWKLDAGGPLHRLLHSFKYSDNRDVGDLLGGMMAKQLLKDLPGVLGGVLMGEGEQLLVCPIPLHPLREKKRGYNQSRLLSEKIACQLGVDLMQDGLVVRCRNTPSQTGLRVDERWKNVDDAFQVADAACLAKAVQGKTLIVVDDVFTTGATCYRLVRTIREAVPQPFKPSVVIVTAARA